MAKAWGGSPCSFFAFNPLAFHRLLESVEAF
jgi:hypothetical protein